jgi:aspartyl-tRNA(Asn)/glutamyl-tRNA(Gln) amidotransferase subunit C
MSVSLDDVRHIAALARLGLSTEKLQVVAAELNTILVHMEVLSRVDTDGIAEAVAASAPSTPVRADHGPPLPLGASPESFAPATHDGFFLVPRLATHEDAEATS